MDEVTPQIFMNGINTSVVCNTSRSTTGPVGHTSLYPAPADYTGCLWRGRHRHQTIGATHVELQWYTKLTAAYPCDGLEEVVDAPEQGLGLHTLFSDFVNITAPAEEELVDEHGLPLKRDVQSPSVFSEMFMEQVVDVPVPRVDSGVFPVLHAFSHLQKQVNVRKIPEFQAVSSS